MIFNNTSFPYSITPTFTLFLLRTPDLVPCHRSGGEGSPTPSTGPGPVNGDRFEGMLVRKHELESGSRKASHRGWDKVFCAVVGSGMAFFKVTIEHD